MEGLIFTHSDTAIPATENPPVANTSEPRNCEEANTLRVRANLFLVALLSIDSEFPV